MKHYLTCNPYHEELDIKGLISVSQGRSSKNFSFTNYSQRLDIDKYNIVSDYNKTKTSLGFSNKLIRATNSIKTEWASPSSLLKLPGVPITIEFVPLNQDQHSSFNSSTYDGPVYKCKTIMYNNNIRFYIIGSQTNYNYIVYPAFYHGYIDITFTDESLLPTTYTSSNQSNYINYCRLHCNFVSGSDLYYVYIKDIYYNCEITNPTNNLSLLNLCKGSKYLYKELDAQKQHHFYGSYKSLYPQNIDLFVSYEHIYVEPGSEIPIVLHTQRLNKSHNRGMYYGGNQYEFYPRVLSLGHGFNLETPGGIVDTDGYRYITSWTSYTAGDSSTNTCYLGSICSPYSKNFTVSQRWSCLIQSPNMLLAIPYNSTTYNYTTCLRTSSWTAGTLPISGCTYGEGSYGNGIFVVPVYSTSTSSTTSSYKTNKYIYSTDGLNWTQGTLPRELNYKAILFKGGIFVAVSGTSLATTYLVWSKDGKTWHQQSVWAKSANHMDFYEVEGKVIALNTGHYSSDPGYAQMAVYSSSNNNWSVVTLDSVTKSKSIEKSGVVANGQLVFTVQDSNNIYAIKTTNGSSFKKTLLSSVATSDENRAGEYISYSCGWYYTNYVSYNKDYSSIYFSLEGEYWFKVKVKNESKATASTNPQSILPVNGLFYIRSTTSYKHPNNILTFIKNQKIVIPSMFTNSAYISGQTGGTTYYPYVDSSEDISIEKIN